MCGITGVIGTYLNNQNLEKQLHELMQNRGPDDQGHLELEFQNQNKIKKSSSKDMQISLKKNIDIIASLSKEFPDKKFIDSLTFFR